MKKILIVLLMIGVLSIAQADSFDFNGEINILTGDSIVTSIGNDERGISTQSFISKLNTNYDADKFYVKSSLFCILINQIHLMAK